MCPEGRIEWREVVVNSKGCPTGTRMRSSQATKSEVAVEPPEFDVPYRAAWKSDGSLSPVLFRPARTFGLLLDSSRVVLWSLDGKKRTLRNGDGQSLELATPLIHALADSASQLDHTYMRRVGRRWDVLHFVPGDFRPAPIPLGERAMVVAAIESNPSGVTLWWSVMSSSEQAPLRSWRVFAKLSGSNSSCLLAPDFQTTDYMSGTVLLPGKADSVWVSVLDQRNLTVSRALALGERLHANGLRPPTPVPKRQPAWTRIEGRGPRVFDFGDTLLWANGNRQRTKIQSNRPPRTATSWAFGPEHPDGAEQGWNLAWDTPRLDSLEIETAKLRFKITSPVGSSCLSILFGGGEFGERSIGPGKEKTEFPATSRWRSSDVRVGGDEFMEAVGWRYDSDPSTETGLEGRSFALKNGAAQPRPSETAVDRTLQRSCPDASGWHVVDRPITKASNTRIEAYGTSPEGFFSFALDLPR